MMSRITDGSNSKQKGFTLIELMIAMVLGLILVAGVIQIFISNKQAYRVTDAHSKLQDNARFALEVLSRDVRSAGFSGCRAIEDMNVISIADAPPPAVAPATLAIPDENTVISGLEAQTATTWAPVSPPTPLGTVVGGTDVITVQRGRSCGGNLIGNLGSSNANIQIIRPNICNVQPDDVLMIADCTDAHIFRATNVSDGTGQQTIAHAAGNQANHFCKHYPSFPHNGVCNAGGAKLYDFDAELLVFSSATYFIRLGTNGDPALWVYDNNEATSANNPIELIEGIEDMQIVYGLDTNDDDTVENYSDASVIDTAGNWNQVISARISLLAQTQEQNLTTADQSINFDGAPVADTSDGRLRRVFTTTIGVRNRVQ